MMRLLLISLFLGYSLAVSASSPLKPFVPGSYQQILQRYQERPFILVFWSLDCPPCFEELQLLSRIREQRQNMPLVLVSIDGREAGIEASETLQQLGLSTVEAWLFSEAASPRLLNEVDPAWYGTVPRSYLFDSRQIRQPITGALTKQFLLQWLNRHLESDFPLRK